MQLLTQKARPVVVVDGPVAVAGHILVGSGKWLRCRMGIIVLPRL